jgi:uncharacterized membrane protein
LVSIASAPTARRKLKPRYARGEITKDEFDDRIRDFEEGT